MSHPTPCESVRDLVSSAPERADALPDKLARHAERCASCQAEIRASERLLQLLDEAASDFEPAASPSQLADAALSASGKKAAPERRVSWLWLPVTAAAAIAVGVFVALPSDTATPDEASVRIARTNVDSGAATTPSPHVEPGASVTPSGPAAVATTGPVDDPRMLRGVSCRQLGVSSEAAEPCRFVDGRLETGLAERVEVRLSDETTLWLNHQTTVELLPDRQRSLRLSSGEALIEVVRQGSLGPLQVMVPTGRVEVVGTKLQVKVQPRVAVVDVLRGKVVVHSNDASEPVEAGAEAVLTADRAPAVQAASDLGVATEWTEESDARVAGEPTGFGTLKARRPGAKKDAEQALRLVDHQVKVRVQGELARTEIEEEFANDTPHTLEGIYSFPLPPNARIAALDLMVEGKWEHGAIVERDRAEKIWRGVIRNATPKRKQRKKVEYIWVPGPWKDPALLTWKQGSQFELRIFPIPGRGARRVRIAYTEVLDRIPGGRRYVLPLAADPSGAPRTERFRFDARIGGAADRDPVRATPYPVDERIDGDAVVMTAEQKSFAPTGDIVLEIPDADPARELKTYAYQDPKRGDFALLALRPAWPIAGASGAASHDVLFVVDSSYSTQALRLERAAQLIERITAELGPAHRVHVLACSATCKELSAGFRPATPRVGADLRQAVTKLEPLGSTRLAHALERAGEVLRKAGSAADSGRVIYLGDGIPTVGEQEPARLAEAAREALRGARLTTVSLGGGVDEMTLTALARAGGGAYVKQSPGMTQRSVAFRVLSRQLAEPLLAAELELPSGAVEIAPASLGDWWPGEEKLVLARLKGPARQTEIVLRGRLGGQSYERRYEVDLDPRPIAGNAFLPRLWAQARIADLELGDDVKKKEQIVKLSTGFHVLSRHTSLLVLESPAMARAFKVADTRPPVEWTGEEAAEGDDVDALGAEGEAGGLLASAGAGKAEKKKSKKAAMSRPRAFGMLDDGFGGAAPRRRRGGRWVRARKVWYREATIKRPAGVTSSDRRELGRRETRRDESPESRDRTRDLVRWHVRMGDLDAAEALANRWLVKDRMDAEALVSLAGISALRGDPDRSRELLASAVEVDPRNANAHTRMMDLYRAARQHDLACDHALTRALVDAKSWKHQADAVRCDNDVERHLAKLSKSQRRRADKALAKADKTRRVRDKLTVEADWRGGAEVDILVVTPRGRVVSWQGGAKRVRSEGALARSFETLAASLDRKGRYQIWVVPRRDDGGGDEVTGSLRVRAYSKRRNFHFTTRGAPQLVADIQVASKFRLERL